MPLWQSVAAVRSAELSLERELGALGDPSHSDPRARGLGAPSPRDRQPVALGSVLLIRIGVRISIRAKEGPGELQGSVEGPRRVRGVTFGTQALCY